MGKTPLGSQHALGWEVLPLEMIHRAVRQVMEHADLFFLQDFQDMLRDPGLGPVVEGQRDLKPWHAS